MPLALGRYRVWETADGAWAWEAEVFDKDGVDLDHDTEWNHIWDKEKATANAQRWLRAAISRHSREWQDFDGGIDGEVNG